MRALHVNLTCVKLDEQAFKQHFMKNKGIFQNEILKKI